MKIGKSTFIRVILFVLTLSVSIAQQKFSVNDLL